MSNIQNNYGMLQVVIGFLDNTNISDVNSKETLNDDFKTPQLFQHSAEGLEGKNK